jgi:hypothetical protein
VGRAVIERTRGAEHQIVKKWQVVDKTELLRADQTKQIATSGETKSTCYTYVDGQNKRLEKYVYEMRDER